MKGDPQSTNDEHGVPLCTTLCSHHDGKRCELLGFPPSRICEPAVRNIVALQGLTEKLTFGELTIGDHFISWPLPGDNAGHGGYKGAHRLFVRTGPTTARDGRGVESTMPTTMPVVRVLLG